MQWQIRLTKEHDDWNKYFLVYIKIDFANNQLNKKSFNYSIKVVKFYVFNLITWFVSPLKSLRWLNGLRFRLILGRIDL